MTKAILPGGTLGILGGGQLGRMLAQAAQTLGYRVHVYDPVPGGPAGAVAHREFNAPYDDVAALSAFARSVDVVTYEFENIPAEPLAAIAALASLRPRAEVLHICQNREREKAWLRAHGIPHVPYAEALAGDIAAAIAQVGLPCVVKTADFGYDGKGQMRIESPADQEKAEAIFRGRRSVVEKWVDFRCELSVIVARGPGGEVQSYPAVENGHARHILDYTIVPARVSAEVAGRAEALARRIATELDVVGLLAVEIFFTAAGEILVNELAPRAHNSGHWSIDAGETSQFEQQVRAVCGLPLGPVGIREPVVMLNLLGDLWFPAGGGARREPDWTAILRDPRAKLHLYGKAEARPGRKMGHFTVRAAAGTAALAAAQALKASLA
jgi:5-(carboxyamino)imidazole ribonucleotide synthase